MGRNPLGVRELVLTSRKQGAKDAYQLSQRPRGGALQELSCHSGGEPQDSVSRG